MNEATKLTFTVDEAAGKLGIDRTTAYAAVHDGSIPSIRIGRRILVPKAALNRLLESGGAAYRRTHGTEALD